MRKNNKYIQQLDRKIYLNAFPDCQWILALNEEIIIVNFNFETAEIFYCETIFIVE